MQFEKDEAKAEQHEASVTPQTSQYENLLSLGKLLRIGVRGPALPCPSPKMRHASFAVLTQILAQFAFSMFFLLVGILSLVAQGTNQNHVVMISLDGLAAFYLSDPQAPIPTLRRLAAEGAQAEALTVANPSTTWPNHTTLITGVYADKHSVLFNGVLVRGGPGQPVRIEADRDQNDLIAVPTLYDQLHRAGNRTAAINWPCTRSATTLDDNFPDAPDRIHQTTPRFRAELVRAGILDDIQDASFMRKGPAAADQAWTAAARHILQVRPPNLLLLHLLETDVIQHRYGPQTPAAYTALALADELVADVLRALGTAGLTDRTTLLIVSDHGFAKPTKLINPDAVLRKAGLLRPAPHRRAQSVSEGGTAFVYLTNPSTAKEDRKRVLELLGQVEGIARILEPEQYAPLHLPNPASNPQMGDLLLVANEGYTFSDEFFEDDPITPLPISLGSHGYLSADPRMNGVLIAWGRGIRRGSKLGLVESIDVAPTIAALLDSEFQGAQGKVLKAMLDFKPR
jgi:predicted AlkP superfamily pyrophosphatase or phosphodiesterase